MDLDNIVRQIIEDVKTNKISKFQQQIQQLSQDDFDYIGCELSKITITEPRLYVKVLYYLQDHMFYDSIKSYRLLLSSVDIAFVKEIKTYAFEQITYLPDISARKNTYNVSVDISHCEHTNLLEKWSRHYQLTQGVWGFRFFDCKNVELFYIISLLLYKLDVVAFVDVFDSISNDYDKIRIFIDLDLDVHGYSTLFDKFASSSLSHAEWYCTMLIACYLDKKSDYQMGEWIDLNEALRPTILMLIEKHRHSLRKFASSCLTVENLFSIAKHTELWEKLITAFADRAMIQDILENSDLNEMGMLSSLYLYKHLTDEYCDFANIYVNALFRWADRESKFITILFPDAIKHYKFFIDTSAEQLRLANCPWRDEFKKIITIKLRCYDGWQSDANDEFSVKQLLELLGLIFIVTITNLYAETKKSQYLEDMHWFIRQLIDWLPESRELYAPDNLSFQIVQRFGTHLVLFSKAFDKRIDDAICDFLDIIVSPISFANIALAYLKSDAISSSLVDHIRNLWSWKRLLLNTNKEGENNLRRELDEIIA